MTFAHHPTEIIATLDAAHKYPQRDRGYFPTTYLLLATIALVDEFAEAFE